MITDINEERKKEIHEGQHVEVAAKKPKPCGFERLAESSKYIKFAIRNACGSLIWH